jgi:hypothetical protein
MGAAPLFLRAASTARGAAALALCLCGATAMAQEYSRFIACEGRLSTQGQTKPAFLDLALRYSNRTAAIQRSNVLPIGEVMAYTPTPANYAMTYRLQPEGTQVVVVPGWFENTILVSYPNLKRLNQIRLAINRQTGALNAALLNERDETLGTMEMACVSASERDLPPPKL